jgi:glycosyltransferase involved in cell wall biosynthesis
MSKGISVIVCCYNSEERLPETLSFLAKQKVDPLISWEVIVVDNASTDNIKQVAFECRKAFGDVEVNLRIIDQPIAGLSNARSKGIEAALFDVIILCDDDNHLNPDYVVTAYRLMYEHTQVGIIGGWVKPKLPFYPGRWIEDFYGALAIGKQGATSEYVNWVFGAGMIVRKQMLYELTARKISLLLSDRKGSKQSSGGDAELCSISRFIGYKVYYSPELILHHSIAAKRLRKSTFFFSNKDNFLSTVHLFFLDELILNQDTNLWKSILKFAGGRTKRIFTSIPRLPGRRFFLYSVEVLGNTWFLVWIMFNMKAISGTFQAVKQNLYGNLTNANPLQTLINVL